MKTSKTRVWFTVLISSLLFLVNFSTLFSQNWQTSGNAGLNGNSFIGTSDNSPVSFKTNGSTRLKLDSNGKVIVTDLVGTGYRFLMVDSAGAFVAGANAREGDPGDPFGCENVIWMGTGNNASPYCKIGTLNNSPFRTVTNGLERMRVTEGGLIGIGTADPLSSLQIADGKAVGINANKDYSSIGLNLYEKTANFYMQSDGHCGLLALDNRNGLLQLTTGKTGIAGNPAILFKGLLINEHGLIGINNTNPTEQLSVTGNGNFDGDVVITQHLGIGTNVWVDGNSNKEYLLNVNGPIRSKEIKVYPGWADHVFADTYLLLNLDSLSQYIEMNKHLPGIPSEKEVLENGIDVGEMNAKLLEKVEELTLYVIKLKKEVEALNNTIETTK